MNSMILMRRLILQDNSSLVGKLKSSKMPYYDIKTNSVRFKARPVLVLKAEKETGMSDFTVLPISSVSFRRNINPNYDVKVTKTTYPNLDLTKKTCYIRCGKIMTVNKKDLAVRTICDLKGTYPELWQHIIDKTREYLSDIQ